MELKELVVRNTSISKNYATCLGNIICEGVEYFILAVTSEVYSFKNRKNSHLGMRWEQLKPFIITELD